MKHLEIGGEPTLDLYLEHLVECFQVVRRVLRDDGVLVVNLGDRYTSGTRRVYDRKGRSFTSQVTAHHAAGVLRPLDPPGLKEKDLCLMPQRAAMALQADGWHLRSMIPWVKRNVMPESVEDRPATALEYFFMFSKSEDCYYDRDAVTVAASPNTHPRASVFPSRKLRHVDNNRRRRALNPKAAMEAIGSKQNPSFSEATSQYTTTKRNRRNSDWFLETWVEWMREEWEGLAVDRDGEPIALIVNPVGTDLPHFASYPPAVVRPFVAACTSEKGCCPNCGAPLVRIIEKGQPDREHQKACGGNELGLYTGQAKKDYDGAKVQNASDVKRRILAGMVERKTVGWRRTCDCLEVGKDIADAAGQPEAPSAFAPVPCRVLDPFHGTGRTAQVCVELGRDYVGCDIHEGYIKLSDVHDAQGALALL